MQAPRRPAATSRRRMSRTSVAIFRLRMCDEAGIMLERAGRDSRGKLSPPRSSQGVISTANRAASRQPPRLEPSSHVLARAIVARTCEDAHGVTVGNMFGPSRLPNEQDVNRPGEFL